MTEFIETNEKLFRHLVQIHYTTNTGNPYLNTLSTFGPQMQRRLMAGIVPSMMKHCIYGKRDY